MADVVVDLQNASPKELFGQGVRAYVLQDYDTAVQALSKASELLSTEHGNETHDSLGDVYLYYGKALLELSRKESGPLGDGVIKNIEEESESEEDVGEEKPENDEELKSEGNTEKSVKPSEVKALEEVTTQVINSVENEGEAFQNQSGFNGKSEQELSESQKNEETEEELTDLQVAWEVLELAKTIFASRGNQGKRNLAEAVIILGEISLESGNYSSAIEDMTYGLNIQKTLFENDSRTIAETYYKLGGAFSTNGQIGEAIESFQASFECLQNKLNNLNKNSEPSTAREEEIEELNILIPEIKDKIADMKNLIAEIASKAATSMDNKTNSSGLSTAEPSSSKPANDISHLVKRKRKDDEVQEENPAKKPSP